MTYLQAALGVAQFEELPESIHRKHGLYITNKEANSSVVIYMSSLSTSKLLYGMDNFI